MSGTPILPFTEANTKRVASLFRQALRTAFDHLMKWDVYRNATIAIRQQFDANKHISTPEELDRAIKIAEAKLKEWKHPDPYVPPCRPGGTKYQRNIPVARGPLVPGDW
ncbi:NADH dehydrogenase [ubiquinone] 1 beta subcomplex subunit 9 [Candida viswanathii]|jgi:NADH dehydrogenase (ubiquinone) 1 beta subcomplex subunit 9|uniref:NADH dehydrogenase [ubiquinone] 1 beta subcomplex subunit 9 n=1 Tax=Candida viswanathii TaxID=5486 RepID=A0A367XPA6_9ASCO|nr:NADH dehydrogenase [ubiquinone] 1 beta subcomplex subunit 9 [Candida viswanathii]